ncbi:MAG: YkgJ family cysteine cluster protein [Deltaproteobacteria bacterium]|nr:YkgJ family cysteine cluster protein [Deltaproteobacteria bacterium]
MSHSNTGSSARPAPRMEAEHYFRFRCAPGLDCFTQCCRDVNIVLTPYDLLRLKNALAIDSNEFIEKYAIVLSKENRLIPLVFLKMREDDKQCPFVTEQGCTVYENRPWACRMFPLDAAEDGTFYLITDSSRCKGLDEPMTRQIGEWLVEQGVVPYDEMNQLLTTITAPLKAQNLDIDNPDIAKMIFMCLYNLDKFRDFIFKSSFLSRFELDPLRIEKIKRSDLELLKFAFDWIKFGIFGEKLFKVKQPASDVKKA